MGIVEELGKKFEKTPGFGYIVALASTILGIVLNSIAPESSLPLALMAIAISFVAYWVGGLLDNRLFEPFYGLPPEKDPTGRFGRFWRRWFIEPIRRLANRGVLAADMINARTEAAKKFHPTNQRGIYNTAKKLLENTELWDGRIKLWLDLSKATRTLILPALCLLAWQLLAASTDFSAAGFFGKYDKLAWLGRPISAISILVISLVLYINLRLRHMRLLYQKIADIRAFRFVVPVEATAGSGMVEVLWSVGERVVSERELPVFRTASMKDRQLAMMTYQEKFPIGTTVRIADLPELERFLRERQFDHKLEADQLAFAGRTARVTDVSFYRGGDVFYNLDGVPGSWQEVCVHAVDNFTRTT